MTDPPYALPTGIRRLMLVAGEPSGDVLGARLMAALRLRTLGQVEFYGIGGEQMQQQGLQSLFPMSELSLMGLVEVLPKIPGLLARLRETADTARMLRPDALVTIDAPGFNFRLARRLHGAGMPLIHFVAPTVWAWRPKRAAKIARFLDHLLVMLPFEPPWFERHGLQTTFVGHPVLESGADRGHGPQFRARHGIEPEAPLLCLLPGSRQGEVSRLLPVFAGAVELLRQRLDGLRLVMPTVGNVEAVVRDAAAGWAVAPIVTSVAAEKYDAMAAANAALAASGTVALELALAGTPAVIAYKVNPLTAFLARRLINVRHVNLVNIILDRPVVTELLQQDCTPAKLADAVERVMIDPAARQAQREASAQAAAALGRGGDPPSLRAADAILHAIDIGPRRRTRSPGRSEREET